MTKKHFQALARALANANVTHADRAIMARSVAAEMAQFNPLFNKAKFLAACGVE